MFDANKISYGFICLTIIILMHLLYGVYHSPTVLDEGFMDSLTWRSKKRECKKLKTDNAIKNKCNTQVNDACWELVQKGKTKKWSQQCLPGERLSSEKTKCVEELKKKCFTGGGCGNKKFNCNGTCATGYEGTNCQPTPACTAGEDKRRCQNGGRPYNTTGVSKKNTGKCGCRCPPTHKGSWCSIKRIGCTDKNACNYDSEAHFSSDNCMYPNPNYCEICTNGKIVIDDPGARGIQSYELQTDKQKKLNGGRGCKIQHNAKKPNYDYEGSWSYANNKIKCKDASLKNNVNKTGSDPPGDAPRTGRFICPTPIYGDYDGKLIEFPSYYKKVNHRKYASQDICCTGVDDMTCKNQYKPKPGKKNGKWRCLKGKEYDSNKADEPAFLEDNSKNVCCKPIVVPEPEEKTTTPCGDKIRAIKEKAKKIPLTLKETAKLCCRNNNCSKRESVMAEAPTGSKSFGSKPDYDWTDLRKQLDKIATTWDTKGTRGYPQKATDLGLESQELMNTFQNDVVQYGNESKYYRGGSVGSPGDPGYCTMTGEHRSFWNQGSEHKELMETLNTAKKNGCF